MAGADKEKNPQAAEGVGSEGVDPGHGGTPPGQAKKADEETAPVEGAGVPPVSGEPSDPEIPAEEEPGVQPVAPPEATQLPAEEASTAEEGSTEEGSAEETPAE